MQRIHESVGSDNAIRKVKEFLMGNNEKGVNYLGGSISQYTKNLIMTFPVLCDSSLSPETASMISKANERNITTMLQLLFTAMNIEANDGMKVLSQIHNNIKTNMDVYEVMDKMDDIAAGLEKASGIAKTFESVETSKGFMSEKEALREMTFELKNKTYNKSFPVESLSEQSLNRFTITKGYNTIVIREAEEDIKNINQKVYEIIRDEMHNGLTHKYLGHHKEYNKYLNSKEFSDHINEIISTLNITTPVTDDQRKEIENEVREIMKNELKNSVDAAKIKNLKMQDFAIARDNVVRLVDTDVKKANELQPTILQINYSERKENGDVELRTFLAGVKSRLVAVSSSDIIERIIAKNRTKINFLNFIRATTGEIGFFKDFLFAIDQAKLDSKNAVKKGEAAAIWNCLASRAAKNNKNRLKKLGNDASAITVLVISQETANYMKSVHKFDIEKMNNTKMICDVYNLMGIIIADESIEVVKTYYVGNNGYEQVAYSYLEKENKNSDYKKVVNLMSQMNTR